MAQHPHKDVANLPRAEDLLESCLRASVSRPLRVSEAVKTLASELGVSAAQLAERSANGDHKFEKNVRWAVTHLAQAQLVERPEPGSFRATDRGENALADGGTINFAFLKRYPEYLDFLNRSRRSTDQAEVALDGADVEVDEIDEEQTDFRSPYDPKAIRVDPRVYSIRNVLDMIDENEIDLAPDFQRLRVWKPWQKSQLIESLLLRIPLPTFYLSSDEEGLLQVVDGVQRLSTIHDFVRKNGFQLAYLEYLSDILTNKRFSDIENTVWSRRILNTQINAYVIDPQTPNAVKFDIFRRINTGGSPLNSQEIRHCMSHNRSRNFLRALADEETFHTATGGRLWHHVRMEDREFVLRFVAFYSLSDASRYDQYSSMDDFLTSVSLSLDNPSQVSTEAMETIRQAFVRSMTNAFAIFGKHAFRKWYEGTDDLYPLNRSLFDVWSVELARFEPAALAPHVDKLQNGYRDLITHDEGFHSAISTSTSSAGKVMERFHKVRELVDGIVT